MYPDFYLLNLILPQPLLLLRAAQEKEGSLSSPFVGFMQERGLGGEVQFADQFFLS